VPRPIARGFRACGGAQSIRWRSRFGDPITIGFRRAVAGEDVAEARRQWAAEQFAIDPDRVVFIDETWAKTNLTRTYGRSPRAFDSIP